VTVTGFVQPEALDYAKNCFRFETGAPLTLDVAYLANQLPLLRDEPSARYEPSRRSVVTFFPPTLFDESEAYRDMMAALRASVLAPKIDWAMFGRRRELLHATICGRVEQRMSGNEAMARFDALRGTGPFRVRVTGLWVGREFNRGRFYFPLYPEVRYGENAIQTLQRAFGLPTTNFYAIGAINLTADLDAAETAALGEIVRHFGDATLFETTITELALTDTNDDLLLSGKVVRRMKL
jgi:hypothetical protein